MKLFHITFNFNSSKCNFIPRHFASAVSVFLFLLFVVSFFGCIVGFKLSIKRWIPFKRKIFLAFAERTGVTCLFMCRSPAPRDTTSIIFWWICEWKKNASNIVSQNSSGCRLFYIMPYVWCRLQPPPSTFLSPASTSKLIYGSQLLMHWKYTRDYNSDISHGWMPKRDN